MKIAIWLGGSALAIALVCAFYVMWGNLSSRNIGLATATLFAASVLFIIQLWFELRGSTEVDHITVEYTVDHQFPGIYQFGAADAQLFKMSAESMASQWLATHNPNGFAEQRVQPDMAIASLFYHARSDFSDWQMRVIQYKGRTPLGRMKMMQPLSKPNECSIFSLNNVKDILKRAGNVFADAEIPQLATPTLCFPPGTKIVAAASGLTFRNPVYELEFVLDESGGRSYVDPNSKAVTVSQFNGKNRYETFTSGFTVNIKYSDLHSWDRNRERYRDWVTRFVSGAHRWFEGESQ
jgi:hypothetical protein